MDTRYNEGYDAGYEDGHREGHDQGYEEGFDEGKKAASLELKAAVIRKRAVKARRRKS